MRKSAFGRTSLFLTNADRTQCVKTSSAAMQRTWNCTYHNLAETQATARDVPIACWHCCEPIVGECVFVPKTFDVDEGVYQTYGCFDSFECAKAFLLEQSNTDMGHQINVFTKMLRDVYGHTENVQPAPPRLTLRKFGGPFDIASKTGGVRILEPFRVLLYARRRGARARMSRCAHGRRL